MCGIIESVYIFSVCTGIVKVEAKTKGNVILLLCFTITKTELKLPHFKPYTWIILFWNVSESIKHGWWWILFLWSASFLILEEFSSLSYQNIFVVDVVQKMNGLCICTVSIAFVFIYCYNDTYCIKLTVCLWYNSDQSKN